MRLATAAAIAAAFAWPALAADIEAASRVDRVTVHPDGASRVSFGDASGRGSRP